MRLVLIGDPVAHSLSPRIHQAALDHLGISGSYEARRVGAAGVRAAFRELRDGEIDGINVTMPHKALAASLCDRLDPLAARAGSVNTVWRRDGNVEGTSTDITGMKDAWNGLPGIGPVLILGAGGAAAASCIALASRPTYISARRPGTGRQLGDRTGLDLGEVLWGVAVVGAVVVNCTPLGMKGETLPPLVLELGSGLFDLAYGPETTPAAASVRAAGHQVVEGRELLVRQAARSFAIWTDRPAPLAMMRLAVENP
ncbi:MAG: shikimate dehydrogenase family protein [Actinomycetota bacterium]